MVVTVSILHVHYHSYVYISLFSSAISIHGMSMARHCVWVSGCLSVCVSTKDLEISQ